MKLWWWKICRMVCSAQAEWVEGNCTWWKWTWWRRFRTYRKALMFVVGIKIIWDKDEKKSIYLFFLYSWCCWHRARRLLNRAEWKQQRQGCRQQSRKIWLSVYRDQAWEKVCTIRRSKIWKCVIRSTHWMQDCFSELGVLYSAANLNEQAVVFSKNIKIKPAKLVVSSSTYLFVRSAQKIDDAIDVAENCKKISREGRGVSDPHFAVQIRQTISKGDWYL